MAIRYTPSSAAKVGGSDALAVQIEEAIAGANQLFADSGINVEVVLGYLERLESDPDENGIYPDDNCQNCDALNKQFRPDIQVLIEENGLGYSNIPTSISQALAGMRQTYGVVNFKKNTVAHEVGHGLGLYHGSREAIDTTVPGAPPSGILPNWGMGVVGTDADGIEFHTIMSYGNLSNTSVPSRLFSSPNLLYRGVPTGTEEANSVSAANFFAPYVSAAGEALYPLPISLSVLRNGQQTIFAGDCLDEVAGNPSVGATINLTRRSPNGALSDLEGASCDDSGNFTLTVDGDLSGTFQATHGELNRSTEFVEPSWSELSLFGGIVDGNTLFSGVCFENDGSTPATGSAVELIRSIQSSFLTVAEAICDESGRFSMQLDGSHPGTYEAQIVGKAYSGLVEITAPGGGGLTETNCLKKKKRLKKRIKQAPTKAKAQKLRKKQKKLPC